MTDISSHKGIYPFSAHKSRINETEIETQLEIAKRLNFYVEGQDLEEDILPIKRMLIKFIQVLKQNSHTFY